MKANYAICLVTGIYGKFYSIFTRDDYGTCMVPCKVVFETNSFNEVCNEYEKYKNITISK